MKQLRLITVLLVLISSVAGFSQSPKNKGKVYLVNLSITIDSLQKDRFAYTFTVINEGYLDSYPFMAIYRKGEDTLNTNTAIGASQFYSYGEMEMSMNMHTIYLEKYVALDTVDIYLHTMTDNFPVALTPVNKRIDLDSRKGQPMNRERIKEILQEIKPD